MLRFDPTSRITVEEALQHPYLGQLHYPDDEPTRDVVPRYDFDFERQLLTAKDLKDLIYEDILLHHFPDLQEAYAKSVSDFERNTPVRPEETKEEDNENGSDEESDEEELP